MNLLLAHSSAGSSTSSALLTHGTLQGMGGRPVPLLARWGCQASAPYPRDNHRNWDRPCFGVTTRLLMPADISPFGVKAKCCTRLVEDRLVIPGKALEWLTMGSSWSMYPLLLLSWKTSHPAVHSLFPSAAHWVPSALLHMITDRLVRIAVDRARARSRSSAATASSRFHLACSRM